jgi:hypothetical protein
MKMTYRDSKFWTRSSLVAASAMLALSLSPAMLAQSTTPSVPVATTPPVSGQNGEQDTQKTFNEFNKYLSNHPEMEQQIKNNPSLLNNPQYLASHPELNTFLQDHPGFANAVKTNPGAVLHKDATDTKEAHADANEAKTANHEAQSYDTFAHQDPAAARAMINNPSLASNSAWLAQHPEAANYVKDHPDVVKAMENNPEAFKNKVERVNNYRAQQNGNHKTPPSHAPQGHPASRQ